MYGDIGLRIVYSTVVQVVNDPKNGEQSQRCIVLLQKMVALLRVVSVKLHRYEEKVRSSIEGFVSPQGSEGSMHADQAAVLGAIDS
jgi:hypothetical protein